MKSPSILSESSPTVRYTATVPFYLAATFLALISFPGLLELPGGISAALVGMLVSLPFWFRAARLRNGPIFDSDAQTGISIILLCTVFLIAWAFLSALGAAIPFRAGRSIASLAGAMAVYFLVLGTITRVRMDAYLRIACLTLAATCFVSLIALFEPTLNGMIYKGSDRAAGFFKNPNQLGIAISTLMPVTIGCLIVQREHRMLWSLCVLLFLLGLVLSGSKTNLLLTAMTTGGMILSATHILYTGLHRVRSILLGLGIYVIFLVSGFLLLNALTPRAIRILDRFFSPDAEVQSLNSRAVLWQYSIDQFMADPVFGQGAGQFLNLPDTGRQVAHSHNIILDYIRTLGLPGLVGFLIIAIVVVILTFGAMRMALAAKSGATHARVTAMGLAVGSLAYLAANAASDSMGPSTSPFFWIVFFLCLASRRLLRRV